MLHISKILVPYDFSMCSKKALEHSLVLAQFYRAELHVIYIEVLHQPLLINSSSLSSKAESFRKQIEEANIDQKKRFRNIVIHYAVGQDLAAGSSILQYAQDHDIDLIVIGTHGRQGIKRMFLGSVAEEVVRHASCPVMTIQDVETQARSLMDVKKILVPVDFSVHAKRALEHAKEIAALSDAKLDLFHIIPLSTYPLLNETSFTSIYDDTEIETKVFERLRTFYSDSKGLPGRKLSYTVNHGLAAEDIIQRASEDAFDLIVIGTHGLRGLDRLLLGSVTTKVVRHASIPVFIVKSFGKSLLSSNPPLDKEGHSKKEMLSSSQHA